MTDSTERARVTTSADGEQGILIPGVEQPFRVLSMQGPHLVLEQGGQIRRLFLSVTEEQVVVGAGGYTYTFAKSTRKGAGSATAQPGHDDLSSPMPGTVLDVLVKEGAEVARGDRLLVVEAMKMENPIRAPHDSIVSRIHVKKGDSVAPGQTLIELDEQG